MGKLVVSCAGQLVVRLFNKFHDLQKNVSIRALQVLNRQYTAMASCNVKMGLEYYDSTWY